MDRSNLFLYYNDRKQVYQKLIEDQRRDLKEKKIYGLAGLCCLAAAFLFPDARLYLSLGAAVAMINVLIVAMDRSNRNWFLHFLDYEEWKEDQAERFKGHGNRRDLL